MLSIKVDRPNCHVAFGGDPFLVAAEMATVISKMYQGMKQNNPMDAEIFKQCIQSLSGDSMVWNPKGDLLMFVMPGRNEKGGAPTDQS